MGVEAFEALGLRVIVLKPQTIAPGQLDKSKFWVPNGSSDLGAVTTLDGQCRPYKLRKAMALPGNG